MAPKKKEKVILVVTRNLKKKGHAPKIKKATRTTGEKFAEWVIGKFAPKYHMRLKPKTGLKRKKKSNAPLAPPALPGNN
jgi:hypothetical protein